VKAKVVAPKISAGISAGISAKAEEPKEIKPIKALVKDKKENKCVELDLFGGF
jgi:hypothetical protein